MTTKPRVIEIGAPAATDDRPTLLNSYEKAVEEFEAVSRVLTSALVGRNPADYNFHALLDAEERARESVVLARLRLINHWNRSHITEGTEWVEPEAQVDDATRAP